MTRTHAFALTVAMILAGNATGQVKKGEAPPVKPVANKGAGILDDRVDALLRQWSGKTANVKSLYAEFTRVSVDRAWKTKESATGSARYIAPNKARLDILEPKDKCESVVLTGTEIWKYTPSLSQLHIYELPPEAIKNNSVQDGPLPFFFGADPEKAKVRYKFSILEEDNARVHVRIDPKLQEDKSEFVWAELWMNKQTFLPDKLYIRELNDSEMTYEFKAIWTDIEINPADFEGKMMKSPPWTITRKKIGSEDRTARVPPPN